MRKLLLASVSIFIAACSAEPSTPNQDSHLVHGPKNTTATPLYGAEVYSQDKVLFGKFVIRMKMVSQPGVVSSFFTYDNESWQGDIPWREIDIEAIGKEPDLLQTNLITGLAENRTHSENAHTVANLEEFNEFTLIWTPDKIEWQVNHEVIHKEVVSDSKQVREMRDSPQSYRMNIWISEAINWVGRFDNQALPLFQVVDWIEYYEYSQGEFQLAWRDDFNDFDSHRWGKGDWGFESNLVTFNPNNVGVIDGQLILALTNENTGIEP
ncbi:family 16 glycosylhydrolase [Vibrio sp. 10N.261.55.A7]|uniref:family 16 glycosylhydrolase n=1 Tax=Vibrio sp. 10N.261.55.A7 TaxID=1880851 RepID=UPI000C863559|nr:family 16 glycosylhydrolase [Vibrio sp. 10N.261.55.A7]PMJ99280.1 endo-beta-1,3-1,4 glucanase [Vibrio sp. 10N.261.55.A7]